MLSTCESGCYLRVQIITLRYALNKLENKIRKMSETECYMVHSLNLNFLFGLVVLSGSCQTTMSSSRSQRMSAFYNRPSLSCILIPTAITLYKQIFLASYSRKHIKFVWCTKSNCVFLNIKK